MERWYGFLDTWTGDVVKVKLGLGNIRIENSLVQHSVAGWNGLNVWMVVACSFFLPCHRYMLHFSSISGVDMRTCSNGVPNVCMASMYQHHTFVHSLESACIQAFNIALCSSVHKLAGALYQLLVLFTIFGCTERNARAYFSDRHHCRSSQHFRWLWLAGRGKNDSTKNVLRQFA